MKTLKQYNENEILELMQQHNEQVKETYRVESIGVFADWIESCANDDNNLSFPYIEIASNETLSGHACIIELDWEE